MTESVGTRFKNGAISPGVFQAVSIAENVNGAVLRTLIVQASSNAAIIVYTGSTTPTGLGQYPTVFVGQNTSLSFPLYVPPGQGIWLISSQPFSPPSINLTWDVL